MNRLALWLLQSRRNLVVAVAATATAMLAVTGITMSVRLEDMAEARRAAATAEPYARRSTSTLPTERAAATWLEDDRGDTASAAEPPQVGPGPAAVEVTAAWLAGDADRLGDVLTPDTYLQWQVTDRADPGGKVTGAPTVHMQGGTSSLVEVPTTAGPVTVRLIQTGGGWQGARVVLAR